MMSFKAYMNVGQHQNVFLEQKHFIPSIYTSPGTYGVAAAWHKFSLVKQRKSSNAEMTNLWLVISFNFILCYGAVIFYKTLCFRV